MNLNNVAAQRVHWFIRLWDWKGEILQSKIPPKFSRLIFIYTETQCCFCFIHVCIHCLFVHFGGGAMKRGVCLFGLISYINFDSQKSLTTHLKHDF